MNFIPESYLLFAQIRSLYRKTAAKASNWYQRCDFIIGTRISVWNIPSGKTGLHFQMLPVGPVNFPLTRPKNSCSLYFFLFLHEEDRICLTTLSGADRTKTLNSNSPPQLEMVRNGPQSLDANDVMVNARGLPGGDVEDSNGPFPSFPGLCFKTRVGAQPLIWKSFFILLQMKLIFTRKIVHVASF